MADVRDDENKVHPALKAVADSLEGGDIEHHAAMLVLDQLGENWTNIIRDPALGTDHADMLDELDRTIEVLRAMKTQVSVALAQAIDEPDALHGAHPKA